MILWRTYNTNTGSCGCNPPWSEYSAEKRWITKLKFRVNPSKQTLFYCATIPNILSVVNSRELCKSLDLVINGYSGFVGDPIQELVSSVVTWGSTRSTSFDGHKTDHSKMRRFVGSFLCYDQRASAVTLKERNTPEFSPPENPFGESLDSPWDHGEFHVGIK